MSLANQICGGLYAVVLWSMPLVAQSTPVSAAKSNPTEEKCIVSGMVVSKVDEAPLKGATVHLQTDEDHAHTIAAKSGADGRFELKNVPAGQYHISVSRNGYFRVEYGQNKPGQPGAVFSLRPGERKTDLLFRLGRAGVITGRVFNEDGEPMPGVMISAMRSTYENGRAELQQIGNADSNDLGEYRIFGLVPGRYYISAENSAWDHVVGDREFSGEAKNSGEKGYTKIYFPNAADPGKASLVTVKEGEEIPAIDFLMKEITVYRIRGKLVNLVSKQGHRPSYVSGYRRNERNDWMGLRDTPPGPDGSFEIGEVPPGEYTIVGMVFDDNRGYIAQQDVDVTSADVDGVILAVGPGVTIPGTIIWEGKPDAKDDEIRVDLRSEQRERSFGANAHVEENWQFTLKDTPDGEYKVQVFGLSKNCYIKEVRLGQTLLSDTELRVKGAGGNLEITVSSRGAEVDGSVVTNENMPATGVWVVAVPEEEKRKYTRLYKAIMTDQYGHYELHGLAPGKYKLFSWEGVKANEWEDPDFRKQYEDKGESVEVNDGDKKTAQLNVIQAKDSDAPDE